MSEFPFIVVEDNSPTPDDPHHDLGFYETAKEAEASDRNYRIGRESTVYVEWDAVKALLTKMAEMHRPGTDPDELACQRGIASDMTCLFAGDFKEAALVVWGQEYDPELIDDVRGGQIYGLRELPGPTDAGPVAAQAALGAGLDAIYAEALLDEIAQRQREGK